MAALSTAAAAVAQPAHEGEAEALSARGVAGEIMDTAVEHCRRGESAQALSMFAAIRDQLDPPPPLLRLIRDLEATGCTRTEMAAGGTLRLQSGAGWDSNVSQGITSRSLALGSGANLIELELDDSYRPRSSGFVTAAIDYSLALPERAVNLQVGVAQRKNTSESAFDVSSVSAAASRDFKLLAGDARAQLELSQVWLSDQRYQRSQGAGLQWLRADAQGAWLGTLRATHVEYITQPAQNAWQWEAGVLREHRLNVAQSVHAAMSLQWDGARGMRAGGDRKGYQVQVGGVVLAQGWRLRPQLSYTWWESDEVFAPGLIDRRRRNALSQASFQAERPLSARTSLVLEWRGRWARDTVALYRYQAHSLSATLAHRF